MLLLTVMVSGVFAAKKPDSPQTTCVTEDCHAVYTTKAFVHGPVELGDCKSCHKSVNPKEHTFEFIRKGVDLCGNCHLDQAMGKNIHKPVQDGDCTQCHDPHSSDNKFMLTEKTVGAVCENCHQVTGNFQYLHGPAAVGECTICHDSHSSNYKNLLTVEPMKLCFSCHESTKKELEKFEFVHKPATGDCAGCHDPHGADNWKMLKSPAPQMCYPCHEEISKTAETSRYKHSVFTKDDGCLKCHTPHASTVKYILKNDPATLCMTCHSKPLGVSKDEVLPAFTDELKDKKFMHGPVAEKDCNGCHKTHGSDHFRLLIEKYPPEFYSPFAEKNYKLCFTCHEETLVQTQRTTKLTDFRNGNLNLHYLHVNKAERGRTCRSCHQTHASNLPKHIRASVPYGMWDLPIQFEKSETGGSCKPGCHIAKPYDRKSPVDYSIPIPVKAKEQPGKKDNAKGEPEPDK